MAVAKFHEFPDRETLAQALAKRVVEALVVDHESGDFASLALSGGSTPTRFLELLGAHPAFDKDMAYIAMVDERFVPPDHERSNERMIRARAGLKDHPASEFLSLYAPKRDAETAALQAEAQLLDDDELPFDALTLGMGTDGHTASFFPGGDNLAEATDPGTERLFVTMNAPGVPDTRLTMTLPVIAMSSLLVLHIEGAEKRAVYERALEDGPADDLPIRHVLRHPGAQVHVYWCP